MVRCISTGMMFCLKLGILLVVDLDLDIKRRDCGVK